MRWRDLEFLTPIPIAAAAVFAFRTTLFAAGIPDFRHDWRWPFLNIQLRSALPDVLRVWNSAGLGVPHALVVNHPALWIVHWLSFLAPVKTVLAIGILSTVFFTGWGVARMARAIGVNSAIATCAGIAGALGPPMFDKFVAGHWYYMISIAAMPWAIGSALYYPGRSLPRSLATGALIAITALQVQLWLITLAICAALFAARMRNARSLLDIAILLAAATTLTMPELYGLFAAHSAARYAALQTIPLWEFNNSAPFFAALIGLGYAPGYAESALAQVPWVRICLWVVPIGACAAAFSARPKAKILVLAFAWLALLCLVSGVNGPLAIPLKLLYARFVWASTFRELQHFAEPMWMLATILAAASAQRLGRRAGPGIAVVAALGIVALWLPPDYGGKLRSWDFAARSNALFSQPPVSTASRYLLTPSIQPVGPSGTDFRGADPDAAVDGLWFPENDPEQFGMVGVPALLGERDPNRFAGWLRAAGINAVLPRPYLTSGAIAGSALSRSEQEQVQEYFPALSSAAPWREPPRSLLELRQSLPVVRDPFTARFHDGFLLERVVAQNRHDPDAVPARLRAPPIVSRNEWNPARDWVNTSYWWWLDPQVAFWPAGALTWSKRPLPVPESFRQDGYAHVVVFAGQLLVGRRAVRTVPHVAVWVPLRGATSLQVNNGAAMVIELAHVMRPYAPAHLTDRSNDIALQGAFSPDCACGQIHVGENYHWLILKQSYDESWRVTLDHGRVLRHVSFAGYGNAWRIEAAPGTLARVEYAPARTWQLIVRASLVVWLLIAAAGAGTLLWTR